MTYDEFESGSDIFGTCVEEHIDATESNGVVRQGRIRLDSGNAASVNDRIFLFNRFNYII